MLVRLLSCEICGGIVPVKKLAGIYLCRHLLETKGGLTPTALSIHLCGVTARREV